MEDIMKSCRGLIVIATFLVIAAPATLPASDGDGPPVVLQPNWGLGDNIVHTIASVGFAVRYSSMEYSTDTKLYMFRPTSSYGEFFSPLTLPAGARIVAFELEACDDSNLGQVTAQIVICPHRGANDCILSTKASTGITEIPGCDGFFLAIDPPLTVDNLTNTYVVYVYTDVGEDHRFLSVLVSYQLQISPAPFDPTFPDVSPSYWAFQEIEALAASGITTGFPDGTFRPTAAVTRAQMATFLARALGLHWPY